MTIFGLSVHSWDLVGGAMIGLVYGLLAVGMVLVYRSSRFVNFAHGDIGFFGSAVMVALVRKAGVPYWVAFLLALLVAAAVGASAEVVIVRRLRRAPRLMSMVATLILGQFLLGMALIVDNEAFLGINYPVPPGMPELHRAAYSITQPQFATLILTPLVVLALTLFLRRSRWGIALRAAASNGDAAVLAGMPSARLAMISWALAGALAAFTAMLWLPTRGVAFGQFGPSLLVRALAPAVIAGMSSLPIAFGAGVALGIAEGVLSANFPGGETELLIFIVILGMLLLRRPAEARGEAVGIWNGINGWTTLPATVLDHRRIRVARRSVTCMLIVVAALAPLVLTNDRAFMLEVALAFALVGISVAVVSGLAGQLSFGQFGIAAAGAVASVRVVQATDSFVLAVLAAIVAGAVSSMLVGLPALRLRGIFVGVTTLAFAVAMQSWILKQPWTLSDGLLSGKPEFFGWKMQTNRGYYAFVFVVFVLAVALVRNFRGSGLALSVVALRDNEPVARAWGVPATRRKMEVFAFSGAIAGVGGALYAHTLTAVEGQLFPSSSSIMVVAMAVLGGIGFLAGPIVGALYISFLPDLLGLDAVGRTFLLLGALILILGNPGGLVSLLQPIRDRVAAALLGGQAVEAAGSNRLVGADDAATSAERPRVTNLNLQRRADVPTSGQPLLVARSLVKSYGGIRAVDDVSFEVVAGETLGLIGPNGAGKTTVFEILSGFTQPDGGIVSFRGQDITALTPETRARMGMGRSFQEAAMFPTMRAREAVMVALQLANPSQMGAALAGRRAGDRSRGRRADDLLDLMGLGLFAHKPIAELSTGSRRLVEITCMLALQPMLLLLDEPASGVAQGETEHFSDLLEGIKRSLGTTVVVIEHDIPLVRQISDRVVAMDAGRVLGIGSPDEVLALPQVVESYMGGNVDAIERSGMRSAVALRLEKV